MNITIWLSLIGRLGALVGGRVGALIGLVTDAIGTVDLSVEDVKTKVEPWIAWIDGKIAARADLTDAEHQAAIAFADAVRANNESLIAGNGPLPIPLPPA